MESMLAAYGSARRRCRTRRKRILNLDIGGGTTKLAIVSKGDVVATAARYRGPVQVVDDTARIVR